MPALPDSPEAVTPEWLHLVLLRRFPDCPTVDSIDWELVGEGFGLTGVVVRLRPRYRPSAYDAPASLILKLPLALPEHASQYRVVQSLDTNATRRYFERCAREVDFYRELAPDIDGVAPHALYAEAIVSERAVALLLEDLSGGRSGDVLAGCEAADAQAVVKQIARVHARWWERETPDWLPIWGGDYEGRQARLAHQIPLFFEKWGQTVPAEAHTIIERLGNDYKRLLKALDRRPLTVIHADLHLDNVLFDAPGRDHPVVLDWQSVSRGPAIVDIGSFVAGSLEPRERRQRERALLTTYHDALVAGGVTTYPFDRLTDDYRLSLARMLPGIVGWLANIDSAQLEGRERRLVEAALGDGRLIAALLDHDILGLLDDL